MKWPETGNRETVQEWTETDNRVSKEWSKAENRETVHGMAKNGEQRDSSDNGLRYITDRHLTRRWGDRQCIILRVLRVSINKTNTVQRSTMDKGPRQSRELPWTKTSDSVDRQYREYGRMMP